MGLFGISYDSVDTLAAFAAKYGITYPLLSDDGSREIRRLGMLDDELDRHHAEFGRSVRDDQRGVAYPMIFLLDRDGTVLQKRVHRNYRIRDTGTGLLEAVLGIRAAAHGPDDVVQGEVVRVRAYLDSSTYRPYQQLRLAVELVVREGWHIYTAPVPTGYIPLRVEVTPFDGLESGQPVWPPGRRFTVAGLDEEFFVLDGTVRASIPLTLSVAPGRGDLRIAVAAHYQACSETACLPPTVAHVDVSVSEAPFPE